MCLNSLFIKFSYYINYILQVYIMFVDGVQDKCIYQISTNVCCTSIVMFLIFRIKITMQAIAL